MVSSRCKKILPSLQVDDDNLMVQEDDYVPSKKKADDATFKTGIPKSVTYLVIEGSTVNTTENTELDDDSREAQDHDDHDDHNDNWEHPEDTEEFWSTNDTEDAPENTSQTSWEEISEVSSVHSFHSKTGMTFLDVARLATQQKVDAAANKQQEMDNWVAIAKARKHKAEEVVAKGQEELLHKNADSVGEMGEQFDADFMLNGTKGLRGGKEKFMFNRQPKKKYRQWRSKSQLDSMVSCGRVPPAGETSMISDRQGNRIMVKA
ncbi:MAG: hypothetical protein SGBAC_007949 [Bacillariaceae sp.]